MVKKKVLIIGAGGREHALGWKIKQSPEVEKIYFAPGNGGTSSIGENVPIPVSDIKGLTNWAKEHKIDFTVVGPEDPLVHGVVDAFTKAGLKIFGPVAAGAMLEASKAAAVEFMQRQYIPHPQSYIFSDPQKAINMLHELGWKGFVIKADGLALGKGVIVCDNVKEAEAAIDTVMVEKAFGEAGNKVLIQERLDGEEVSLLALSDGNTVIPLVPAQDHKRIFEKDKGPNTGGMGAYAPVPFATKKIIEEITRTILQPTIDGLRREGIEYKGVLYAGLMLTKDGPKVLEYNVRFGDPETQPIMMLFQGDILEAFEACVNGTLTQKVVAFKKGAAICVVLAAKGYPESYEKGQVIEGLDGKFDKDVAVFQAGTSAKGQHIITSGGRVLGVSGYDKDLPSVIKKVYKVIGEKGVHFAGMQYRKDIAHKALKFLKK